MARFTIADFAQLQPWADEIKLCNDCEAAAYRDVEDAQAALEEADRRLVRAKHRHTAMKDDREAAELAFASLFNEMTRSALLDDDAELAEMQRGG
jgi:hypothetical protein